MTPVIASFLFCVIRNLGCKSGRKAKLVQPALGPPAVVAGADVGASVSRITHRPLGSLPCFTHASTLFA